MSGRDTEEFEPLRVILAVVAAAFVAAGFVFFRSGYPLRGTLFSALAFGFLLVGALLWIRLSRRDN